MLQLLTHPTAHRCSMGAQAPGDGAELLSWGEQRWKVLAELRPDGHGWELLKPAPGQSSLVPVTGIKNCSVSSPSCAMPYLPLWFTVNTHSQPEATSIPQMPITDLQPGSSGP